MVDPSRKAACAEKETAELLEARQLDRRSWRNWFLFVSIAVLTTVGLGAAILTLLGDQVGHVWPWSKTDQILLAGLSAAILMFALYLTQQERQVGALRRELIRTNKEATLAMRRAYDRLVALLGVSRVLATETNPQTVFDSITETCLSVFECQQASLLLLNATSRELEVRSVAGHDAGAAELTTRQQVGHGLAGWVARERRPLVLGGGSMCNAPSDLNETPPFAAMVTPIVMREELVGVLSVSSSSPGASYDQEDLQAMLLFAESVGICCRHAEQTSWMRQTIQRLDAALQDRTPEEGREAA
jgi:hypothetical protein